MIYHTSEEYWGDIAAHITKYRPRYILISTYNFYSATRNWKFDRPIPDYMLNCVQKIQRCARTAEKCKIVIGVSGGVDEIDEDDCEKYRFLLSADMMQWPYIEWYIHPKLHGKATILLQCRDGKSRAWTGGINLTLSDMADNACTVTDKHDVSELGIYTHERILEATRISPSGQK